jgi:hypothetical protein
LQRSHLLLRVLVIAGFVLGRFVLLAPASAITNTIVSISGTRFTINAQVTYPGRRARGLLLNSRMANAVIDDENPDTVGQWAYPDTHAWDPQRNTDEFVAMLPAYAANGLNMVTVSLQGGLLDPEQGDPRIVHPEIVTAFGPDGSLKAAWMARLDQVIRAADTNGVIVDVSLFYRFQDERITTDAGIVNAVNNVTDYLVGGGYTNVLLEICNECSVSGIDHANLNKDEIWKLIRRAQVRSGGKLLTSSSFGGIHNPPLPESVIRQADFISLHCNNQTPSEMTTTLQQVRATASYQAEPKPIEFTECGSDLAKMEAAIAGRAGWGYHDQGLNNYWDGFQSPPINWSINTDLKRAFFDRTRRYAGLPTS